MSFSFSKPMTAVRPQGSLDQRIKDAAFSRQAFDEVISWIDSDERDLPNQVEHFAQLYRDHIQKVGVPVFCFGSNLAGIHGKEAALFATQERGAIRGQGIGLQGNSYAIPTKDMQIQTLSIDEITDHVCQFLDFAQERPDMLFEVTPIGCGLAGYVPMQIAPLFLDAPFNCMLPKEFGIAAREIQAESAEPQKISPTPKYK